MKNLFLVLPLLLAGCSVPLNLLGGQEGEPLDDGQDLPAPPPPGAIPGEPPPPDPDADGAFNDDCVIVASCAGEGWCADYSQYSSPEDLETECTDAGGVFSDQPCEIEENAGFCRDPALDSCTTVWLFDDLGKDEAEYCEDIGLEFVSPRG